jgi:hypothetical protein
MTPAINPSAAPGTAPAALTLTREQVDAYRSLLRSTEARRAAAVALSAIQSFASRLNVADLIRGSVVHGGDWEAWLSELAKEAHSNLATVKTYRASFEEARLGLQGELCAHDAAAIELIGRRRSAAATTESRAKSTRQDYWAMRKKLTDAGLTSDEVTQHLEQRFNGGFEALEAGILRERDASLADAQALEDYLSDPDRAQSALPDALRDELRELAQALPLRANVTDRMPVAALRAW